MKKLTALILSILLIFSITACTNQISNESNDKIKIVCTAFPQYDWAREITGYASDYDILLLGGGEDIHNFQPSVEDIINLKSADAVIYIGGTSDNWVSEVLYGTDAKPLNMLECIGTFAKEEAHSEGMEEEHENHAHHEETELDEHVWLSLKNAAVICKNISDILTDISPEKRDMISQNTERYIAKINALDVRYAETISDSTYKTLIFADRFPFLYMADDYNLSFYAAFPGCSAESEASFETIAFLSKKLDELALPSVMVTDGANMKMAETVLSSSENPNRRILSLSSMQSAARDESETYLSVMEQNLDTLRDALN